jgi:hypothetical protein
MSLKINKLFISLFVFLTWSLTLSAESLPEDFPKCYNSDVRQSDYCPLSAKLGHKIFLVDFTSRWEGPQIKWVKGRIFGDGLINDTPPYHKISYLKIDDVPPHSQEFVYSKCRFKKGTESQKYPGEKVNKKCEGTDVVKSIFKTWNKQIIEVENQFFPEKGDSKQSLIYEYIIHTLRETSSDFGSDYKERELVIVSDLMQFSKRVNFFKHCKSTAMKLKPKKKQVADKCGTFAELLKKEKSFANYMKATKPTAEMVENLKVKVLFINHSYEHGEDLYISLEKLWKDMFSFMGIDDVKIVPQIDYKI